MCEIDTWQSRWSKRSLAGIEDPGKLQHKQAWWSWRKEKPWKCCGDRKFKLNGQSIHGKTDRAMLIRSGDFGTAKPLGHAKEYKELRGSLGQELDLMSGGEDSGMSSGAGVVSGKTFCIYTSHAVWSLPTYVVLK